MVAYYNERDPFAAQWLRNLIAAGLIAPGHVDDRSIEEVRPDDLAGFTQCHFFAGIAGWSLALRLAGWPDDRPLWTGSCPCQPFSAAGKGEAFEDERHLWPVWFELIRAVRPPTILGEQVDDAIGWGWLDLVHDDMEAEGYSIRAAVLPACGVGAPHIRDRLWFVGVADRAGSFPRDEAAASVGYGRAAVATGDIGELGDAPGDTERRPRLPETGGERPGEAGGSGTGRNGSMGDAHDARPQGRRQRGNGTDERAAGTPGMAGPLVHTPGEQVGLPGRSWQPRDANPWSDLEWLPCTDGKARPTKPGLFPLAHGIPARVGKLRAAGNAIVPQVAAEFIRSVT